MATIKYAINRDLLEQVNKWGWDNVCDQNYSLAEAIVNWVDQSGDEYLDRIEYVKSIVSGFGY